MVLLSFARWSSASGALFIRQRIYWHGCRWTPFVRVFWRYATDKRAEAGLGQHLPGPFALGDLVQKISGAGWRGRIVGTYSTTLTPVGYAVESDAPGHGGSVQIYPSHALRKVTP